MPTFAPRVLVDWENLGIGTIGSLRGATVGSERGTTIGAPPAVPAGEDVTSDVRQAPPITIKRGRDRARQLSPPMAGIAAFTLRNDDARYSSQNTAGPLYGDLLPGRLVQAVVNDGTTDYALFTGYTEEPEERPLLIDRSVGITALDGLGRLRATSVSTAMYTGITTDQAIGVVLDAAGWPVHLRNLDAGATTLARWWVDGVDAFSAIKDLLLTEGPGALVYCDGAGVLVFESRHYRLLTPRATTSQVTIRDQGAEPLMARFAFTPGLRDIVNAATIPVRVYASTPGATIWSASGLPTTLGPGEVRPFTVSASADGFSGATISSGVSAGSVSTGLDRTSGKSATLTVTAGAGGATLTALSVTATAWQISAVAVSHTIDTSASQGTYGIRSLPPESVPVWVPTVNDAVDYCNAVVARYQAPVPQPTVTLNNADATRLTHALARRISDRVHVTDTGVSKFDADCLIEALAYAFDSRGNVLEATLACEQADSQAFWTLGISGYSELGVTTRIGF